MATEHHLQGTAVHSEFHEDGTSLEKWTSKLDEPETTSSCGFDCNICLDLVQDPVVTFCGHLYCWPCIYRWISLQNVSPENPELPQCPVCKAEVSNKTLIPLYGRGQDLSKDKDPRVDCVIPQRPPSFTIGGNNIPTPNITSNLSYPFQQLHRRNYVHPSRPYDPRNNMDSPLVGSGGSTTCLVDPMIGVFGEMVYARIFGNSQNTLNAYPNSYHLAGTSNSTSPRLRRHMMRTDESLSRICFFLCCCVMLCLLLF